ncbi:MAG TPA: alpha-amylase family glycosyl hydrolase [Rectinemataceae bacterium]|nr:alpha-amylase family glycosyl hydrolase [Rectinemataceae bacterium]
MRKLSDQPAKNPRQQDGKIPELWDRLYPGEKAEIGLLLSEIDVAEARFRKGASLKKDTAIQADLVYAMYPDAFGGSLEGAIPHLDELERLGVKTLWILPLLRSPGRDQGFDISDYNHVADEFGGDHAFIRLLRATHGKGMRMIFDIAINHSSDEHPWFKASAAGDPEYRDYYLWRYDDKGYPGVGLIFPGMVDSNWTRHEPSGRYYFHRFYPFQPDLNYGNPRVTREMIKALLHWKTLGVDGFRMDAAALIWKREGTSCESQPETHLILKLFRAVLDRLEPGTLLVAEANQAPAELLPYFGDGDECKAAYHFPLMPKFWQAMAEKSPARLLETSFPILPEGCSWFTFLRCHDEVTLDLISPDERKVLSTAFMHDPRWSFRDGQAFSGRLFELLGRDPDRTLLAFSLLFSLPGTPVLYYGDEIAMLNDEAFWKKRTMLTGFMDSRFFHRGPYDIVREAKSFSEPNSDPCRVRHGLETMLRARSSSPELADAAPELTMRGSVMRSLRRAGASSLEILTNLSDAPARAYGVDLPRYGTRWIVCER